jgi:hypothetical protein
MKLWKKTFRFNRDENTILKELASDYGLSENRVMAYLIREAGKQQRSLSTGQKELQAEIVEARLEGESADQLEVRRDAMTYLKAQELEQEDIRSRAARVEKHAEQKARAKREQQLSRVKALLLRKGLYTVSCETGLSQSVLAKLKEEARAEQEQRARHALRERSEALDRVGTGGGRDDLASRIAVLREEEEPSYGEDRGHLHTLS